MGDMTNIHKEILIPNRICIRGFEMSTTEEDLTNIFIKYGTIVETKIIRDAFTGENRGYGFISFDSQTVAEHVLATCETVNFHGTEMTVLPAKIQRGKKGRHAAFYNNFTQAVEFPPENVVYAQINGPAVFPKFADPGVVYVNDAYPINHMPMQEPCHNGMGYIVPDNNKVESNKDNSPSNEIKKHLPPAPVDANEAKAYAVECACLEGRRNPLELGPGFNVVPYCYGNNQWLYLSGPPVTPLDGPVSNMTINNVQVSAINSHMTAPYEGEKFDVKFTKGHDMQHAEGKFVHPVLPPHAYHPVHIPHVIGPPINPPQVLPMRNVISNQIPHYSCSYGNSVNSIAGSTQHIVVPTTSFGVPVTTPHNGIDEGKSRARASSRQQSTTTNARHNIVSSSPSKTNQKQLHEMIINKPLKDQRYVIIATTPGKVKRVVVT